jgi:soluble lytic murein transglycosylase
MHLTKFWEDSDGWLGLQAIPGARLFLPVVLVLAAMLGVWQTMEQHFFYPRRYSAWVEQYAAEYELDPALLYAVIHTESRFKSAAVSKAGARGLTQITPETFQWLQQKTHETLPLEALHNPEISVRYGALFLHILQREFGLERTALAAYHAGRTRVNGWLHNRRYSSNGRALEHIPVPETAHYVHKVMKAYEKYRDLYS